MMKPRWLQRFSKDRVKADLGVLAPATNTLTPATSTSTPATSTLTPATSTSTPATSTSTPATSTSTPATSTPTPATLPSDTFYPSGVKLLHNAENAVVDILFIHGLNGDREKSWMTQGSTPTLWPQSLLPVKIPNSRVLTFGYDAHVADLRGMVSKNRIGNHAMNLLTTLATYREDDDSDERPLIFVCHSLGGLVCEDALLSANQRPEKHLKRILEWTRGIVFLGTPHHGSGLAHWADKLATAIGLLKQTNSEILATLKSDSEVLARIQDGFHAMIRQRNQDGFPPIDITCFYEELPLLGVGIVVPSHSAILPGYTPIGIRRNHMDIIRFGSMDDPGFTAVTGELRRWVKRLGVSSTVKQPAPPLVETPTISGGDETEGSTDKTLFGNAPRVNSTPAVSPIPENVLRGEQSPIAAGGDVRIGNSEQNLSGTFYGNVQISQSHPFAAYLPQANMGPNERTLLKAASKGDVAEGRRLIGAKTNIDSINEEGQSALTMAVLWQHMEFVQLLLDHGATIERSGFLVHKPLHVAVRSRNIKIAEALLDHGADIDEATARGTVLGIATGIGDHAMTIMLLRRGADPDMVPPLSPMYNAIISRNEPIIIELLKYGAGAHGLHRGAILAMKRFTPACRNLLQAWAVQHYEQYAKTLRRASSDRSQKEAALFSALSCANEHGHQEVHSLFMDLAIEHGILVGNEHCFTNKT